MKTNKQTAAAKALPSKTTLDAAAKYAKKVNAKFSTCTVIRAVTQRYQSLRRRDVLHIAGELKINTGTAARQFFLTRSGAIQIEAPRV